jgi:RND superfamily putative drug exporter
MHEKQNKVINFFEAIARFSIKFKWLVVLIWIIATIVIVKNLPNLSSVSQSNNSSFLPASSPSEKAIQLGAAFGTTKVGPTVEVALLASSSSIQSSVNQSAISALSHKLSQVNGVVKVTNGGFSPDNKADELVLIASSNPNNNENILINNIQDSLNKFSFPNGLRAYVAGDVADAVANSKSSGTTNNQLELYSVIFIIVLLLIIFRAPLAPLVTLIPPFIVVLMSGPLIAEAANHGLKISSLAQLLLTVLVLGAGTDYGLFLIFRVREEYAQCLDINQSIVKAMGRVGESITFSAATVIAALLSLLLATFELYSNLGIPLAIGIALMLIAALTFLPALLAIFKTAVFWPFKPNKNKSGVGLWGKISASIVRKPLSVLIVGLVVFIGLGSFVVNYQSGGFAGSTSAPNGTNAAIGDYILKSHFPKSSANPTEVIFVFKNSIWSNLSQISSLSTSLQGAKNVFSSVNGPLNPNGIKLNLTTLATIHSIGQTKSLHPKQLGLPISKLLALKSLENSYISPNGKSVLFLTSLQAGDPNSTSAMNAVPAIRETVTNIAKSNHIQKSGVIGEAPALYDINNISQADLIRVIPVAIIVIGILLGILIRSIVAPIYLILSVGLSYLASLGLSVLLFIDLVPHSAGLVFILPFLMFLFLLALGEDYNILVMTRIREESHGLALKKAVPKALSTTGTTVTSAGLVLAGTFAVFAFVAGSGAGGSEFQDIGFGLAAGIILDTFLVRTLLVPSTVVLLGKWNWWPSKHGSWADLSDKPTKKKNKK